MGKQENYDIQSLREKMLALLGDRAKDYPEAIEKRFPHILAKLVELWGKPAADVYLDRLMVVDRPQRQGFPFDAASEILRLSMIHSTLDVQKSAASKGGLSQYSSDFDDFAERRSSR